MKAGDLIRLRGTQDDPCLVLEMMYLERTAVIVADRHAYSFWKILTSGGEFQEIVDRAVGESLYEVVNED